MKKTTIHEARNSKENFWIVESFSLIFSWNCISNPFRARLTAAFCVSSFRTKAWREKETTSLVVFGFVWTFALHRDRSISALTGFGCYYPSFWSLDSLHSDLIFPVFFYFLSFWSKLCVCVCWNTHLLLDHNFSRQLGVGKSPLQSSDDIFFAQVVVMWRRRESRRRSCYWRCENLPATRTFYRFQDFEFIEKGSNSEISPPLLIAFSPFRRAVGRHLMCKNFWKYIFNKNFLCLLLNRFSKVSDFYSFSHVNFNDLFSCLS